MPVCLFSQGCFLNSSFYERCCSFFDDYKMTVPAERLGYARPQPPIWIAKGILLLHYSFGPVDKFCNLYTFVEAFRYINIDLCHSVIWWDDFVTSTSKDVCDAGLLNTVKPPALTMVVPEVIYGWWNHVRCFERMWYHDETLYTFDTKIRCGTTGVLMEGLSWLSFCRKDSQWVPAWIRPEMIHWFPFVA